MIKSFRLLADSPIVPIPLTIPEDFIGKQYGYQIDAVNLEVSDGFHTMHELYEHRMALNIALFHSWHTSIYSSEFDRRSNILVMKSKLHADGTMFEGYFIVMAITPAGQISYHYKLKHWDKFRIPEVARTLPWDGHGTKEVLERLAQL
jgi:hypothetical protein